MVWILTKLDENEGKMYYDGHPSEQKCFYNRASATEFTSKSLAKSFQRVEAYWGNVLTLEKVEVFPDEF